jgi:Uma2 family endonuclease
LRRAQDRHQRVWKLDAEEQARQGAAEADECYIFGVDRKDRPDLAIEVVWTSGGLDKLEVYRRLGVGEVWYWIDGAITVHVLTAAGYEPRDRSEVPDLDLDVLLELIDCPTINQLVARMQTCARSLG